MQQGTSERRDETRAPIDLKVEYKRLNRFFFDYTRNISRGGTFIKTTRPLPIGTSFLFRLFVPTLTEPLVLHGEVRWIHAPGGAPEPVGEAPHDAEHGMGIQFVFANDEERRGIERVVERMMVDSLGPLIYAHLMAPERML